MATDHGRYWYDEKGSLRRTGTVPLNLGLGTLAQMLRLFLTRLAHDPRNNDGDYLPCPAADGLWEKTAQLAVVLQQDLISPGVPRPMLGDPATEGCEGFLLSNATPVHECLGRIIDQIPARPEGWAAGPIPAATVDRLTALNDELEQLVEYVSLAPPKGEPPDLDPAARLCWRLETVRAKAAALRVTAAETVARVQTLLDQSKEVGPTQILPLTRARWAYRCAIDDAEDALDPLLPLVDPDNPVFRNRIEVDLRSDLAVLRGWDLTARRAIDPTWQNDGDAEAFPQRALDSVARVAGQIGAGGWAAAEVRAAIPPAHPMNALWRNPISNADLARAAGFTDQNHMARLIRGALTKSGAAVPPARRGQSVSWSHAQLRRAAEFLKPGKLLQTLKEAGLVKPV